ncbi:MAG: hypothetical protein IJB99_04435, partial [Clostridia bacterium]|nr:hypothetical protein [Clostridia bacterium]
AFRAAQFAARLEARIDDETRQLCRGMDVTALSVERVFAEMEKALVIDSTKYMAEVVNTALGSGNTQSAPNETKEEKKASVSGIGILIGAAVIGIVLFALAATGSFRGAGQRIRKTAGEITGGLFKGNRKK